jgi:WD40 repeat protein
MFHRRQFIGSAAALFAWVPASRILGGTVDRALVDSANWTCRAIQTVARDNANQPPVVTGVSIQPTGKWLAVVGDDHIVSLLDLNRHEFVSHFARHRDWVRTAKFAPDGRYLATAGNDARLLVWDVESLGQVRELATHPSAIIKLDISPDGSKIATVGFDDQIRVYNAKNSRREWTATCPCSDMNSVAFSADGNWVAAGGRNGVIRIWDSKSAEVRTDVQAQRTRIRSLEFTPDGQIVACGNDRDVKIINPNEPGAARALAPHPAKLFAVKLLPHNQLATAGSDDSIHIWDLGTTQHVETLTGHTGTVSCLDSLDTILVSGSFDTQIRIWESQQRAALNSEAHSLGANWSRLNGIK